MPTQVSMTAALPRAARPTAAGKSIVSATIRTFTGIYWFLEIFCEAYVEARTMSRAAYKRYPFIDW